jgi:hypothetical protein
VLPFGRIATSSRWSELLQTNASFPEPVISRSPASSASASTMVYDAWLRTISATSSVSSSYRTSSSSELGRAVFFVDLFMPFQRLGDYKIICAGFLEGTT